MDCNKWRKLIWVWSDWANISWYQLTGLSQIKGRYMVVVAVTESHRLTMDNRLKKQTHGHCFDWQSTVNFEL